MRRVAFPFAAGAFLFVAVTARAGDVEDLKATFERAVAAAGTEHLSHPAGGLAESALPQVAAKAGKGSQH